MDRGKGHGAHREGGGSKVIGISKAAADLAWQRAPLFALFAAAVLIGALYGPYGPADPANLTLLLAMTLLAELLPVEIERRNLRVALSLPFVAVLSQMLGPLAAAFVHVSAVLVATVAWAAQKADRKAEDDLATRLACAGIAAISAGVGTAAWHDLSPLDQHQGLGRLIEALAFVSIYGLVSTGLRRWTASIERELGYFDRTEGTITFALWRYAMYALLAAQVGLLAHFGMFLVMPITFIPVLALRAALRQRARMFDHYYESINALVLMLQRTHEYSHGHILRVADLAEEVAILLGMNWRHARKVKEAAMLHDIGKIAIDEQVLDKPARLDDDEMRHVRLHASFGASILESASVLRGMAPWIRHHHERPDGNGYPDGLSGEQIPIESRIIAVTDAFDAMVGGSSAKDQRSYREPMTVREALAELDRCSGTQFDHRVVEAFQAVLERRDYAL